MPLAQDLWPPPSPGTTVVAPGVSADLHDLFVDLVSGACDRLSADTSAVLLVDPTGSFLDTVAAFGLELNVRQRARVMVGRGFAGIVAAERRPVTVERVSADTVTNPLLGQQGVHSLLGVPLMDGDRFLGVLHVGSLRPRVFSGEDTSALEKIAEQVGHALRQRLEAADLSAAAVLQRSLVPDALPAIEGLQMAARYIPAEGHLGGDWYDVFALPGDRIGLVIGDVAGHGLPAATIMGRLRSALRAYALEHADPAEVLSRLDAKITHFETGVFATVLYGVSTYPYDEITFSSAGHLPPLRRIPTEAAAYAPVTPDLPLGLPLAQPRHPTRVPFPPGSSLMLLTDGLVERRPPTPAKSPLEILAATFGLGEPEVECRSIVEAMFHDVRPQDDATLLVLHRPRNP